MSLISTRTYQRDRCAVFWKTKERHGGLSNMASGYPLIVNGVSIRSSEALYQACRFPYRADVQKLIIEQASPMAAKMVGKPHLSDTRLDWQSVNVAVMRWCLRVKYWRNPQRMTELFADTFDKDNAFMPIVEQSSRDDFWGAKPFDENTLIGRNVLGRLLMELRDEVWDHEDEKLATIEPPAIVDFWLYGKPIEAIAID